MERKQIKCFGHIKLNTIAAWLSCLLAFFPCIFSNLATQFGTTGMLVIYVAAVLLAIFATSGELRLELKRWQINALAVWGPVLLMSVLNRNGDIQHSNYLTTLNMLFMIFYAAFFVAADDKLRRIAFRVLLLYLGIQLIFGFFFLWNPDALISFGSSNFSINDVYYRQFITYVNNGAFLGITSHYSTSAMYMTMAVIIITAYVLALKNQKKKWRWKEIVALVIFLVALVLTQKRAHLLFGMTAIVAMYFVGYVKGNMQRRFQQLIAIVVIGVIAFIVLMNVPVFQSLINRFVIGGTLDETSSGRISQLWTPAWEEFLQHPIIGMGWRQFKYQHLMRNGVNNDVHNIYLQFFAENGALGGLYIIVLLISTYVSIWRKLLWAKKYDMGSEYPFLMFSFGYQTFFLLYGLTGNPFYDIQCFFSYIISCFISCKIRKPGFGISIKAMSFS